MKNYISEDAIAGQPFMLIDFMQKEIINQLNKEKLGGYKAYENMCDNMRLTADIIEILANYINDNFILLKYNPMGCWYKEENDAEELEYYKKQCKGE